MRILVRYVSHKGKLNDTLQEVPLTGSRLKIGRGTDQDIHLSNLRVALAHAELIEGPSAVPSCGRLPLQR